MLPAVPGTNTSIIINGTEPRTTLDMASSTIYVLLDVAAAYSVLTSFFGTLSLKSCQIIGIEGQPTTRRFTPLLCCS